MLKNFIYKLVLNIFKIILPLMTIPYVYRIINPEIMGKIEFSMSITGYFVIFAGFGVYTFGLREVSRVRDNKEEREKVFSSLYFVSILSSLIILVLYLIYTYFFIKSDLLLRNILLLNGINIFSFLFYVEWLNEAFENYGFITKKTMVVKIISVIFIFLLIKEPSDFYLYLLITNMTILLNNLVSYFYIRKNIKINLKNIEIKKYLFPLFVVVLINNINILYTNLDKIFLGIYSKDIQVAYYGIGQKVMSVIFMIVMTVVSVSIPRLAFYLNSNKDEYLSLLNKIIKYMSIIIFPMAMGIIVLREEIAYIFGGENYISASGVVGIFGFRMIEMAYESIISNQIIFLHKKEKIIAIIYGICGGINLILKIVLINGYFGLSLNSNTAIFTTMLSEILIIVLSYVYIKKYLKIRVKLLEKSTFNYLIISIFFIPIGILIKSFNFSLILRIASIVIACGSFYIATLFFIKDSCILENIGKIKKKILKN